MILWGQLAATNPSCPHQATSQLTLRHQSIPKSWASHLLDSSAFNCTLAMEELFLWRLRTVLLAWPSAISSVSSPPSLAIYSLLDPSPHLKEFNNSAMMKQVARWYWFFTNCGISHFQFWVWSWLTILVCINAKTEVHPPQCPWLFEHLGIDMQSISKPIGFHWQPFFHPALPFANIAPILVL